jgi:4-aminobutyrate aminotransferase-like enzyme
VVSGQGLIAALIFDPKIKNISTNLKKVAEICLKNGLLVVYTGRESIKIGPPLTITLDALNEGIDILETSIKKAFFND